IVSTIVGNGSPGKNTNDTTPFAQAQFNGPRGTAGDTGGNLIISGTDKHGIFFAGLVDKEVRLLSGKPRGDRQADGNGKSALFFRPTGIAVSNDGKSIAVADTGNNRVRLITRDGNVTTISSSSANKKATASVNFGTEQTSDEIEFKNPQSVSFDSMGNIYIVDDDGVRIATSVNGRL